MKINKIVTLSLLASTLLASPTEAKNLKILFVPLDNRPVCYKYVKQSVEPAGIKLIIPPDKFIANNKTNGNPTELLKWLVEKSPNAYAAVISTDALIYGGLVGSRTHNFSEKVLQTRVDALADLARDTKLKLYAFSTIMRTPRASAGRVEPPYYAQIGPSIFAFSELNDKKTQGSVFSTIDQLKLQALERNLKKENLGDWLDRRKKNHAVNQALTRLMRMNRFHYLGIGKDDNSPHSSTHLESCLLASETLDLPKSRYAIIDGVDQLGLLLIARAYNEARGVTPSIYTLYAPGVGNQTLPQYSDSKFYDSVPTQILAAGAKLGNANADLIIALNTPVDGISKDSTASDNLPFTNPANRQFVSQLNQLLNAQKRISLADVSYSNGADNGFMTYLDKNCDISKLQAYNGWNTADNAIGYAIAQGILAPSMKVEDKNRLIAQRLVDDWFYQSNARSVASNELSKMGREELKYDLASSMKSILQTATDNAKSMASKCSFTKKYDFKLSFPWNRLFEVDVQIVKKPKGSK